MDLPRIAIGPKGVQLLLEGVRTIISNETYSNLCFSRSGGRTHCPLLDPPKNTFRNNKKECLCDASSFFHCF